MIYLDHAATSWPKPPAVLAAIGRWYTELGVSADRGDGERQRTVAHEVAAARTLVGELLGLAGERVAFVSGATEGLNLALRAMLAPGDHVLTTALEHSSVVRPLRALQRERGLRLTIVPLEADGLLAHERVLAALRAEPVQLFVCSHASNVTGQCLSAEALVAAARTAGTRTLIDASQTAGLCDLPRTADVVVASAHKALLGPPGLGFVAVRPGLSLAPQKQGGTGSSTALDEHPLDWPRAFEAGTPNTPAILGLAAALRGRREQGAGTALQRGLAACDQLADGLSAADGWRLLSPRHGPRVPVLSVVHAHYDPAELGAILAGAGIQVRSGHHCAPWVHAPLGTVSSGTLRLSPGPDVHDDEIATTLRLLTSL